MAGLVKILGIFLFVIIIMANHAYGSMKTLPLTPTLDQGWMGKETGYRLSCGPVSAAQIMAYWALHGFPKIMSAPPTGDVPDKSPQIIDLFRDMVVYTTYDDYNCERTLAEPKLASELKSFLELKGYDATVELAGFGNVTFERIKNEIDAGRPVMLLVTDWYHWMVVKGYDDNTLQLRVLWGHPDADQVFERTIYFNSIKASNPDPVIGANAVYIRLNDENRDNTAIH